MIRMCNYMFRDIRASDIISACGCQVSGDKQVQHNVSAVALVVEHKAWREGIRPSGKTKRFPSRLQREAPCVSVLVSFDCVSF